MQWCLCLVSSGMEYYACGSRFENFTSKHAMMPDAEISRHSVCGRNGTLAELDLFVYLSTHYPIMAYFLLSLPQLLSSSIIHKIVKNAVLAYYRGYILVRNGQCPKSQYL